MPAGLLKVWTAARRLALDEDAPTMVEYALLVALVALIVAVAATVFGAAMVELFKVPPRYFSGGL